MDTMSQEQKAQAWDQAQEQANLNPAIPANPASTQVTKLMLEKQARVTSEGGGGVETPQPEQEVEQEPQPEVQQPAVEQEPPAEEPTK